jgi:antitoxin component YwqK of YwqJK toxin-antitoxin module
MKFFFAILFYSLYGCKTSKPITYNKILTENNLQWQLISKEQIQNDSLFRFVINNKLSGTDSLIILANKSCIIRSKRVYAGINLIHFNEYLPNGLIERSYGTTIRNDSLLYECNFYTKKINSIKSEYLYKNGKYDGTIRRFYPSKKQGSLGSIKAEIRYSNGILNGETNHYRKNGVLMQKDIYESNKKVWTYYYNRKGRIWLSFYPNN